MYYDDSWVVWWLFWSVLVGALFVGKMKKWYWFFIGLGFSLLISPLLTFIFFLFTKAPEDDKENK